MCTRAAVCIHMDALARHGKRLGWPMCAVLSLPSVGVPGVIMEASTPCKGGVTNDVLNTTSSLRNAGLPRCVAAPVRGHGEPQRRGLRHAHKAAAIHGVPAPGGG